MDYKSKKRKDFFEKIALFLANRPLFIIITYTLICFGIGFLLFYLYTTKPQEKDISFSKTVAKPNQQLYEEITSSSSNKKKKEEEENESGKEEGDKKEEEIQEEDSQNENSESEEDINQEDLSKEELEDVLANTLFQLYEFNGDQLPSISERAQIWEDLGLGTESEYMGRYQQNILLLNRLREEISNH